MIFRQRKAENNGLYSNLEYCRRAFAREQREVFRPVRPTAHRQSNSNARRSRGRKAIFRILFRALSVIFFWVEIGFVVK